MFSFITPCFYSLLHFIYILLAFYLQLHVCSSCIFILKLHFACSFTSSYMYLHLTNYFQYALLHIVFSCSFSTPFSPFFLIPYSLLIPYPSYFPICVLFLLYFLPNNCCCITGDPVVEEIQEMSLMLRSEMEEGTFEMFDFGLKTLVAFGNLL